MDLPIAMIKSMAFQDNKFLLFDAIFGIKNQVVLVSIVHQTA
jgi:hypothetical protein